MINRKPIAGIISFTDPRKTGFAIERERYIEKQHKKVADFLNHSEIEVCDPLSKMREGWKEIFGVRTTSELNRCLSEFRSCEINAIIIGCWHWTEPMLPLYLIRELDVPILLFTESNPAWADATLISAIGASLWESAPNRHAITHERIIGDFNRVLRWIRGVAAVQKLKRSSLMMWGGTYCLRMEHLQDDVPKLKSFLVGDILSEGQYMLIKRAEKIPANKIENFLKWLRENGTNIVYDNTMLNEDILKKQIALYLAARERLKELSDENIAGVSIKCQPELSEEYGVTACLIPSFLPFGEDSEGRSAIIPTVCEGDIKGLITSTLLYYIAQDIPPLFGDLKYIAKDYMLLSNCGGSSVHYARHSKAAKDVLPHITISGQCQGKSGGAVGYKGQPGKMTVARLIRLKGHYFMQLGLGESKEITAEIMKNIMWGVMWPLIAIDLGVDPEELIKIVGSNHYSAIPGDYMLEIKYACREAGIPMVRIDRDEEISNFYETIAKL